MESLSASIVFMSPKMAVSTPWHQFLTTPFAKQHLACSNCC